MDYQIFINGKQPSELFINKDEITEIFRNGDLVWESSTGRLILRAAEYDDDIVYKAKNTIKNGQLYFRTSDSRTSHVRPEFNGNPYLSSDISGYANAISTLTYVCDENGKATSIPTFAFSSCNNLSSISCNNVSSIGRAAFKGCTNLESFFSDNLQILETSGADGAFYNCEKLSAIDLSKVKSIEGRLFYGCKSLSAAYMPSLETIVYNSSFNDQFSQCTGLSSGYFPKLTSDIPGGFMKNCTNLVSVDIGYAKAIDQQAFYGCSKLSTIYSRNAISSFNNQALHNTAISDSSLDWDAIYVVGSNRTGASQGVFSSCQNLKNITLNNVTYLYTKTFHNCKNLAHISMPNLSAIDPKEGGNSGLTFGLCTNLLDANLPQLSNVSWSCFDKCTSLTAVEVPKATIIQAQAFRGCKSLQVLDLPGMTDNGYIGSNAFADTILTGITIKMLNCGQTTETVPQLASVDAFPLVESKRTGPAKLHIRKGTKENWLADTNWQAAEEQGRIVFEEVEVE